MSEIQIASPLATIGDDITTRITEHHKVVSNLDTPKFFVRVRWGVDYGRV